MALIVIDDSSSIVVRPEDCCKLTVVGAVTEVETIFHCHYCIKL